MNKLDSLTGVSVSPPPCGVCGAVVLTPEDPLFNTASQFMGSLAGQFGGQTTKITLSADAYRLLMRNV